MKTQQEVHESLIQKLETNLNATIKRGSMIDIYSYTMSDEIEDMYQEIEDAKNPHLFTRTSGQDLDDLGQWANLPRIDGEDDDTYKYRLKDWVYSAEASNTKAISNILLTPEHAANIEYVPQTHGCGTGTCYVLPPTYEDDVIEASLKEAQERIKDIVSPSLYVEYIVPSIRAVRLNCFLSVSDVDKNLVKANIEEKIRDYINVISPQQFLKIGDLVRIGLNVDGVEYFNVMSVLINEEPVRELSIVQELETKLLYDDIIWYGEQ